jgi:hypothetical protein
MFLTQWGNSRGLSFLFFLWISILIRLIKKTDGAYIENKVQNVTNISTISNNNEVKISTGVNESNIK